MTAGDVYSDGFWKLAIRGGRCEGYLTITTYKRFVQTDKGKYAWYRLLKWNCYQSGYWTSLRGGHGHSATYCLWPFCLKLGKRKTKKRLLPAYRKGWMKINPTLEHHERLMKAVIMKTWSIENGLMTPIKSKAQWSREKYIYRNTRCGIRRRAWVASNNPLNAQCMLHHNRICHNLMGISLAIWINCSRSHWNIARNFNINLIKCFIGCCPFDTVTQSGFTSMFFRLA